MASLALQRPALRPARLPAPLAVGRRRMPADAAAWAPLRHSRCLATLQPAAPGGSQGSSSSGGSSSIKVSRRGIRLQIRGWVRDWDWCEVLLRIGALANIVLLYPIMRWLLLTRLMWYGFTVLGLMVVYSP